MDLSALETLENATEKGKGKAITTESVMHHHNHRCLSPSRSFIQHKKLTCPSHPVPPIPPQSTKKQKNRHVPKQRLRAQDCRAQGKGRCSGECYAQCRCITTRVDTNR